MAKAPRSGGVRVLTGGNPQLSGDIGAYSVQREQCRSDPADQRVDDPVQFFDFLCELLVAADQGS